MTTIALQQPTNHCFIHFYGCCTILRFVEYIFCMRWCDLNASLLDHSQLQKYHQFVSINLNKLSLFLCWFAIKARYDTHSNYVYAMIYESFKMKPHASCTSIFQLITGLKWMWACQLLKNFFFAHSVWAVWHGSNSGFNTNTTGNFCFVSFLFFVRRHFFCWSCLIQMHKTVSVFKVFRTEISVLCECSKCIRCSCWKQEAIVN